MPIVQLEKNCNQIRFSTTCRITQVFTIHDSDGELADYLVVNESKKRGRSVSKKFKAYQFFERKTKPNSKKRKFKTNKTLTAIKETNHSVITSDRRTIHKKLASNLIQFQASKKLEDNRKPTKRCKRCGRFSNDEFCDTHKRTMAENRKDNNETEKASSSRTLPTMPARETMDMPEVTVVSDSQSTTDEEISNTVESEPELTATAEVK